MKKYIIWLLVIMLLVMAGCSSSEKDKGKKKDRMVQVKVGQASLKNVPLTIKQIGIVEAYSTVSVISQASGSIMQVYFKEGQNVRKGEPLFKIDSRAYDLDTRLAEANVDKALTQIKQAESQLVKDQALLKNAITQVNRYKMLLDRGVVTQEDFDNLQTTQETLEASVQTDKIIIQTNRDLMRVAQEQLASSRLQQSYTVIRSPLTGQTGNLLVDAGNVIKANDRPLVSIHQIQPIYVTFNVPEKDLAQIMLFKSKGKLAVHAYVDNDVNPEVGTLVFIDHAINSATGTVTLKAKFDNASHRLIPGQFVNIVMTLTVQNNCVVVPSAAIAIGQEGPYVFIVKPDQTVEYRVVSVNRTDGADTIVDRGVQAGDVVVTDGQLKLSDGSKIKTGKSTDKAGR